MAASTTSTFWTSGASTRPTLATRWVDAVQRRGAAARRWGRHLPDARMSWPLAATARLPTSICPACLPAPPLPLPDSCNLRLPCLALAAPAHLRCPCPALPAPADAQDLLLPRQVPIPLARSIQRGPGAHERRAAVALLRCIALYCRHRALQCHTLCWRALSPAPAPCQACLPTAFSTAQHAMLPCSRAWRMPPPAPPVLPACPYPPSPMPPSLSSPLPCSRAWCTCLPPPCLPPLWGAAFLRRLTSTSQTWWCRCTR
jgi:hypothetical protein